MLHLGLEQTAFLVAIAAMAGTLDAFAGGGGLLTIPALMLVGVPPHTALGTNRVQGCFGELVASTHFLRAGKIPIKILVYCLPMTLTGSIIGTMVVEHTSGARLKQIIPLLLIAVVAYMLWRSRRMDTSHKRQGLLKLPIFALVCGLSIGFYNGFFGPATGSFWIAAFVFIFGASLQNSAMYSKPINFAGNVISLIWFFSAGQVLLLTGVLMCLGQLLGSTLGAHLVMGKGKRFIQPIYTCVLVLVAVEIIVQQLF